MMEIIVGLLVVVIISLGLLLFRQNSVGNNISTPQNFDQTALIDAVKTAVDAQVGKATQQALENVNSQIDRTYQACSAI